MNNQYLLEDKQQTGDLRYFLTVLFKHRKKILTVFCAVVVSVTLASFLFTPVYESKSSLLVKMGREYMSRPEVGDNKPMMALNQQTVINSEIQILTSKELIEKVITTIKLENLYPALATSSFGNVPPLDRAIELFAKNLNVKGVTNASVIEVSFRHEDPRLAAQAVNLLVELFKEKHLQVFSDPQSSFLEKQLADYARKLTETETGLEAFKQQHRLFSLDEQRSLLLSQRKELDTAYKNAQSRVYELQKRIASLQNSKKGILGNSSQYAQADEDKTSSEAKSKLLALQIEEQELLRKYTERSQLVVNVRKELQIVKDFLRDQQAGLHGRMKTGNVYFQQAEMELLKGETDLSSQKAQATALKEQLALIERELQALELSDNELQNRKREVEISRKNYQTYAERAEEARISDNMNLLKLANISIIQAATASSEPAGRKKVQIIALAILGGAVAGLALAFFAEHSAQSFSTPEQVEARLGLPVIAGISYKD